MTMRAAATTPEQDATGGHRLARPSLDDARAAVHSLYGPHTGDIWQNLLFTAGLTGNETSSAAMDRMVAVMQAAEPLVQLCARGLQVRVSAYRSLAAKAQDQRESR
ncbi:hypothetical protein GCM10010172_86330 [Paractinoplanes ferrugineus]|uniref:Uncharacterized protein n=1 Tax=Paractinoplanes ferrugineus TaxID=113564 RepID=A0A919MGU1_9ACTN|nr:hypothetical protein [Actinoplanes ferrugineus]GIE15153.1 hypothetical protein Afe05nite_69930 [Actinoplanes ferrugineus]